MDEFTFKSDAFRSAILCLIMLLLSWDLFALINMFRGELHLNGMSPLSFTVLAIGLLLKIAILVFAFTMKGPLRSLLYVSGGLLVIGGLAHFLTVWMGDINPASTKSLMSLFYIGIGFVLMLPVEHDIKYAYDR